MLKLLNIHKSYTLGPVSVEVLRGLSLEIEQGDLLSIMGPSGSGKSTLMNIIGLLDRPTAGSYLLNGREVSSMGDNELSTIRNAHIGFVFQSFHLLSLLGGVLGTAVGVAGTYVICRFTDWEFFVSASSVVLGISVSSGVGVFFGFQPAFQAARLDPIAALQSE